MNTNNSSAPAVDGAATASTPAPAASAATPAAAPVAPSPIELYAREVERVRSLGAQTIARLQFVGFSEDNDDNAVDGVVIARFITDVATERGIIRVNEKCKQLTQLFNNAFNVPKEERKIGFSSVFFNAGNVCMRVPEDTNLKEGESYAASLTIQHAGAELEDGTIIGDTYTDEDGELVPLKSTTARRAGTFTPSVAPTVVKDSNITL